MTDASDPPTVERIVGVYDADSTLRGEVAYVIGHLIGRRTCSLCDITHSWKGRKHTVDDLAERLPVPFDLLHRDEVSRDLADAAGDWPAVLVITDRGPSLLLDRDDLATCDGDPKALFAAARDALIDRDLLPTT